MNDFQKKIGVGERQYVFGRHAGNTNSTPVVADDGPLRGKKVGTTTEHWSGRVDQRIERYTTTVRPDLVPSKDNTP